MPKMKSNSAASKRIRVTGTGKLMHVGSSMRHNLEHKSARKRRALSRDELVAANEVKRLKVMLNK